MHEMHIALIKSVQKLPQFHDLRVIHIDHKDLKEDDLQKWTQIAKSCGVNDGYTALSTWQYLCKKYFAYLFDNSAHFLYAEEMAFLQKTLSRTLDPNEQDAEISDEENELLEQLLESDDQEVQTPSEKIAKKSITNNDLIKKTPAINLPSNSTCKEPDANSMSSLELIFLGYAKLLQKMPTHLQLMTKMKIANIMNEAELKSYELSSSQERNEEDKSVKKK